MCSAKALVADLTFLPLLAGRSGRDAGAYGSLGSLLYGPVVRGEAVAS